MKIRIRVILSMDERNAICNMMKFLSELSIQTVESIIVKLQIKVVFFLIIRALDWLNWSQCWQ